MRLIDADRLIEKTKRLEREAIRKLNTLDRPEDAEMFEIWSAVLAERSAFKFDLYDAPIIERRE